MNSERDPVARLLYRLMAENRQHARLSEDRRIAISSVTTLVGSGLAIALTVIPSGLRSLPLALWLVVLGILGALACLKLHERAQFHERRARRLLARLADLAPEAQAEQLQTDAEAAHIRDYPHLAALRFNSILVGLNLSIALLGILYLAIDAVSR